MIVGSTNALKTVRRHMGVHRHTVTSLFLMGTLLLAALIGVPQATAEEAPRTNAFSASDINLVVPFGQGGATDILFRVIAEQAQTYLGTSIITMNMPGNGATLGSQFVKQAAPNGLTLLGSHQTIDLAYIAGLSDYSHDAFSPIALLTRTVNIPATVSGHTLTTASEIAAFVEQHPGELLVGIIPNSTDHFFWLHFFEQTDISPDDIQFVRYPDTGAQVVALLGGELDVAMLNLPSAGGLFASGALVPLGVASDTRLAALPEVPTLIEQGIALVNTTDRGLFAPLNTPPERLERLAQAFEEALQQPALVESLQHTHGSHVDFMPRDAYGRYLDAQYDQLQRLADTMAFER